MVLLATTATVIASQSVISGAFSVTRQAVQLGFLPPVVIRYTSEHEIGQIFVPAVNRALYVAVVAVVVAFGSSTALSSAYGVAVTGTFILNTILFLAVARLLWQRPIWQIALGVVAFLTVEVTFFAANLTKIVHGGWLPLVIAASVFLILTTWRKGRDLVTDRRNRMEGPLHEFVQHLNAGDPPAVRVSGTAVFLHGNPATTPLALSANVRHNHVVHDNVVIMSIQTERVPRIRDAERLRSERLGDPYDGISVLTARFGFQEDTDVPTTLRLAYHMNLLERDCDPRNASYFLSQIAVVRGETHVMMPWRKALFITLVRNAANPVDYFRVPDERTVIMGERIAL
jgi:KUP system potassium uptake protein